MSCQLTSLSFLFCFLFYHHQGDTRPLPSGDYTSRSWFLLVASVCSTLSFHHDDYLSPTGTVKFSPQEACLVSFPFFPAALSVLSASSRVLGLFRVFVSPLTVSLFFPLQILRLPMSWRSCLRAMLGSQGA